MTVTDIQKDPEQLRLTITCELAAPPSRVWQLWADPRQLERWWGPPTFPATVEEHDLTPGGRVTYFMTGPDGERYRGWWRVVAADPPHHLEFEDGFADDEGRPNLEMPTTSGRVTIDEAGAGRSRMTLVAHFASIEDMDRLVEMGMPEGMAEALGQIDQLLAA